MSEYPSLAGESLDLSGFLYAHPSFLEGLSRALDSGGTLTEYNASLNPAQADYLAFRADWLMVGQDIRRAMAEFAKSAAVA